LGGGGGALSVMLVVLVVVGGGVGGATAGHCCCHCCGGAGALSVGISNKIKKGGAYLVIALLVNGQGHGVGGVIVVVGWR
jgi:hypothetical protein